MPKGGEMRNKKLIGLTVAILILFVVGSFAETKKLKQLGRYTLVRVKGEVPTAEVMKILVEKYAGDIKYGFDLAGYGDLYLPFLDHLKTATFEEGELGIGDRMYWMLFRSLGRVKVVKDLEWAGKAPVPIFSFFLEKGNKRFEIIMPRACGNIALRKVEEFARDAVCNITVTPAKANINDIISIDLNASQNANSFEVEIYGPDGKPMAKKSLTSDSAKWQTKFDEAGEYVFKAKAFNAAGEASQNPCDAKTYINFPPVCEIRTSCVQCGDYVGKPITLDCSQSSDPDGEVVKVDYEIKDDAGNVIETYSDTSTPFTWDKIFNETGTYTVVAVATDDFGAMSMPAQVQLKVTQRRLFFLVEGGPLLARGSYGSYLAAKAGLLVQIVPDTLDLIVAGGGSVALKESPWKSFFLSNVLLNVHAGPVYFGGGAGYSTAVKEGFDSNVVAVGNIGYDVLASSSSNGSIFFELRFPVEGGYPFSKHNRLMLGFRLIF